jgi:flagellar protein FlgJ
MAVTPVNPSFYADPSALAALKHDAKAQDPEALKQAAKQFESLFVKMLLKTMREASEGFGDSLFSSDQTEFYQSMFDDQMAVHLSQGPGLGLAEMLVRQLSQGAASQSPSGASASIDAMSRSGETARAAPIASSREDFVRQMRPHAEQAARMLGVDPDALIAQAALETGWGRSVPRDARGESSFNLFGIKAGSQWNGPTVNVPTIEFEEGIPVRRVERFRAYGSPAESFRDYAALIRNNPRYENVLGAGADISSFASMLQEAGYATDPRYAQKIVAVARQVREMTSDANSFKTAAAAPLHVSGGAG